MEGVEPFKTTDPAKELSGEYIGQSSHCYDTTSDSERHTYNPNCNPDGVLRDWLHDVVVDATPDVAQEPAEPSSETQRIVSVHRITVRICVRRLGLVDRGVDVDELPRGRVVVAAD